MKPKKFNCNEVKIKISHKKFTKKHIDNFFKNELEPIHNVLSNENIDQETKFQLKRYAIIRVASLIERYCVYNIRKIIDSEKKDISKLIIKKDDNNKSTLTCTDGDKVISTYDFTNYDNIDWVFSQILGIRFFEMIFEMDKSDQFRFYGRGKKTIYRKEFNKIFVNRHKIIHQLYSPRYPDSYLISRYNDVANFFDAAEALCWKRSRNNYIKDNSHLKIRWFLLIHLEILNNQKTTFNLFGYCLLVSGAFKAYKNESYGSP